MTKEHKCLTCKWYNNHEAMSWMTQEDLDNYFNLNHCGTGSAYFCVNNEYSLYESKIKENED